MGSLDQLNRSVLDAIHSGRIGQPVFVRCIASSATGRQAGLAILLDLAASARQLVGSSIHRLYASESPDREQMTLTVQFQGGATALISTVSAGPSGPVLDVLVLGNHGAIYCDRYDSMADRETLDAPPPDPARDPALRRAIEAAIQSGKPQTVRAEDQP